jgi:FG-GAP repeat protein
MNIRAYASTVLILFGTGLAGAAFLSSNRDAVSGPRRLQQDAKRVAEMHIVGSDKVETARAVAGPMRPRQVGFTIKMDPVSPVGPDGWIRLPERMSWSSVISAEDAQAIRLHFVGLAIPEGWLLQVADHDGLVVYEVDSQQALNLGSDIWTPVIVGESAQVRLSGLGDSATSPQFSIEEISYFFDGFGGDDRGALLPCQTGVRCVSVNNQRRNAVGHMTYQNSDGEFQASCVLIEDSILEDRIGYVYTIGGVGEIDVFHSTIDIHWRYFPGACNFPPPGINGLPQNHGASVLAHSTELDYTLLQLWDFVPESPGPNYAPWTNVEPTGVLQALHHPLGETMRYASGAIETPAGACPQYPDSGFLFHDFDTGAMQPGSEGGGVFDANWDLVGVLSGTCAQTGVDPDCDNHSLYSVVSTRLSAAIPEMLPWLDNTPFVDDVYEPNDTPAEAVPLGEGTYDNLTLLHDVYDWFTFTPSCSGMLNITMQYAEVHMGPSLKIENAGGYTIVSDTNLFNGYDGISTPVVANETYFIRVFLRTGDGGPYRLTIGMEGTDLMRTVSATLPPREDLNPGTSFVWASAMHEGTVFVGLAFSDLVGFRSGAVFVYDRVANGAWCHSQTLLPDPDNNGAEFGRAMAVSDDGVLFIGAPFGSSAPQPGEVFVYERVGTTWERVQTIVPPNGRDGDSFGAAIAVDGTYAIIGAPSDNLNGLRTGAAYIYGTFGSPDGSWLQQSRIESADLGEIPELGSGVAILGTTAFATTPTARTTGAPAVVSIRRQPNFTWAIDQLLHSIDPPGTSELPSAVLVGEQLWIGGSGKVEIFDRFQNQWFQIDQFLAPHFGDEFGASMAAFGDVVAVTQQDNAIVYQYRAVPFALPNLISELRPADFQVETMGWSIATDGQALVIDGNYTTAWDDDCNGDGIADHCQLASGELTDTNNNGIPDECEEPDCVADFAPPLGVLDFFDVAAFLDLFSSSDPRADLATPYCVFDFFDLLAYLGAFSEGCP